MEAMKCLLETWVGVPPFAQFHAHVGEAITPGPGAHEGVDVKAQLRHFRDARRKGDEGANHGEQTAQQYCDRAVLLKEEGHPVEIMMAHQNEFARSEEHTSELQSLR